MDLIRVAEIEVIVYHLYGPRIPTLMEDSHLTPLQYHHLLMNAVVVLIVVDGYPRCGNY